MDVNDAAIEGSKKKKVRSIVEKAYITLENM